MHQGGRHLALVFTFELKNGEILMSRGKVVFLDTTHAHLQTTLKESGFDVKLCFDFPLEEALLQLREAVGIVIRSRFPVDKRMMDAAPRLQFIARVGSGMENIDHEYALSRGIHCLNAPEGNRDAVGEHALGLLLSVMNHIVRGDLEVRQGLWRREANRGREIGDKTVAIIGYGNTGGAFARRLTGFGARVIAYDKYRKDYTDQWVTEAGMDEVHRTADIVSLHVPLTDETHHLVSEAWIGRFAKPFWLINTSRGPVVKTSALLDALDTGRIWGAGLDVLEYEKRSLEGLSFDAFPEDFRRLANSPQVVLSPHVAGWTVESNLRLSEVLAEKILDLYR